MRVEQRTGREDALAKTTRRPTKKIFKDYDPKGTESLDDWRLRFVAIADPTEYQGAIELVGSWKEWQRFKREWPEFRERILIEWLAEVEVKLKSEAIVNICAQSLGDKGTAAAKWIAEGRYSPKKAGAPSKAEVERQGRIQAAVDNEVEQDIARVMQSGLKLVGNG